MGLWLPPTVVGQQSVNDRNPGKISPTVRWLLREHGPLLSAPVMAKILGFSNTDALRQARLQQRLPVPMFAIQGRRGWFASTSAVGEWIERTVDGSVAQIHDCTEGAATSRTSPSVASRRNFEPKRVTNHPESREIEP